MRRLRLHTAAEIEDEVRCQAAALHVEADALRVDLAALRDDIAETLREIQRFADLMKELP